MAVRVNLDAIVWSDPRFDMLAIELEIDRYSALGRMAHLWALCTERETDQLAGSIVKHVLGCASLDAEQTAALLDRVELGEDLGGSMVRIRGCEGRTDWLAKKRESGRKGGKASGKSRKQQDPEAKRSTASSSLPDERSETNPPAPAPAPAPAKEITSEAEAPDPKPAPAKKGPEIPDEAWRLADLLATRIRERKEDFDELKPARWGRTRRRWADEFRIANSRQGRSWERLRAVLEWTQQDDFEQVNILSAGKLRKRFDHLELKMAKATGQARPQQARPYVLGGGTTRNLSAELRRRGIPSPYADEDREREEGQR